MDRRLFLRAVTELGLHEWVDWDTSPDSGVENAWQDVRQTQLQIMVSADGKLSISGYRYRDGTERTLHHLATPQHRAEQTAHWFFNELGLGARRVLGVVLVDARESIHKTCFAQLCLYIDEANNAAAATNLPIEFKRRTSAAEKAWEEQKRSGKIVGMDDPVWMAKTQERIDAEVRRDWYLAEGE
jgi:hypothetical protein